MHSQNDDIVFELQRKMTTLRIELNRAEDFIENAKHTLYEMQEFILEYNEGVSCEKISRYK